MLSALLAAGVAGCIPNSAPAQVAAPTIAVITPAAHPLLIKHGWDVPTPAFVHDHITSMERQPFDGLTIVMPALSEQVQSQTPVSYDDFARALAPVARTRFTTLSHNFLVVYSTPAGDLFADWSVPVRNFANLARAARKAGFEGVFYDNEEYFGPAVAYPATCADHRVDQCRTQAQLRGQQVMDAMRAQWPSVRVMATLGPWVSDPATASHLLGVPYREASEANALLGPFVVGMVRSTVGTDAQVVDGGEIYTARSPSQFATVKAWQKDGMATSAFVPPSLRPEWSRTLSAGFGVYDQPWLGVGMDASTWRSTLHDALNATDEYVWAYTERYNWWGTDWPTTPVPAAWVQATQLARSR